MPAEPHPGPPPRDNVARFLFGGRACWPISGKPLTPEEAAKLRPYLTGEKHTGAIIDLRDAHG